MKVTTSETVITAGVPNSGRRAVLKSVAALAASATLPMLSSCASTSASVAANPIAETHAGKLRGSNIAGVDVFKGIRYADSPAGGNRFLPPQPVSAWAGVKDATAFGAAIA
jgi:para-nitrobenzyl esterase